MVNKNRYQAYKAATERFITWMIETSAFIQERLPNSQGPTIDMTTGVPVSQLVSLAIFIRDNDDHVPSWVFRVSNFAIKARTLSNQKFERIAAKSPTPEIQEQNRKHKYFIDALTKASDALSRKEDIKFLLNSY